MNKKTTKAKASKAPTLKKPRRLKSPEEFEGKSPKDMDKLKEAGIKGSEAGIKLHKELEKDSKIYNPTPDSGGASPVEYNLGNGMKMTIDSQSMFKPEYCQKLVEHMRQGNSLTSFGFGIGIGRRTLYKWVEKFPLFRDAYDLAWCGCLKFYEDLFKADTLGLEMTMTDAQGNVTKITKIKSENLRYTLSRRFKEIYAEKQEIEAKTTNYEGGFDISTLTGDELDKRTQDLENQLAATEELITNLAGPNPLEESDT